MGSSKDYHFYLLSLGSKLEIAPSFLDDEQMRRQLVCTAAVDQLCDGIISASLRTGYKTITASYGTGNEIVVPAVYRIVGTFDARKRYESWTYIVPLADLQLKRVCRRTERDTDPPSSCLSIWSDKILEIGNNIADG